MGIGKWESRLRGGLGIGFVQKPYDIETNHNNKMMRTEMQQDAAGSEETPVDFKKIKLKYDVTVVFALK